MAWNIVRHAFAMIFNNFGQALRVTVGPGLLLVAAWTLFILVAAIPLDAMNAGVDADNFAPGNPLLMLLLVLPLIAFSFFVMGWVAVAWHRFILLEEYSGIIPAIADRPIWGYIGKSMLLGLLIALVAIPVSFIVGILVVPFAGMSGELPILALGLSGLLIGTLLGFVWFRTAISLPAKALGKDMGFGEAWSKSKGLSSTILGVTLIIVGLNIGVGIVFTLVLSSVPVLSFVAEIAVNWLSTMAGISVLTTLYGHLVEGRSLG